jgi:hypothetical protein
MAFLTAATPFILLIDGTLERRWGRRIAYKGRFHDAVRSPSGHVVTSVGMHWLCLMLLGSVPWCLRRWALPVLSIPTLTPATSAKLGKRHRTTIQAAQLYDPVPPQPRGKPGVKPKKGSRQPKLIHQVKDKATAWLSQEIASDAGQQLKMDLLTGGALWHRDGEDPLALRWVLLRDPSGKRSPFALCCTDPPFRCCKS